MLGFWLRGSPAGEESLRLYVSVWLRFVTPLTQTPHLHVRPPPYPPLFNECGQPVWDLFKGSSDLFSSLIPASFRPPLVPSRRPLCREGLEMVPWSQLSDTVSALSVCLSISIRSLHLGKAKFRGRWLLFEGHGGYFRTSRPQTFTQGPDFGQF